MSGSSGISLPFGGRRPPAPADVGPDDRLVPRSERQRVQQPSRGHLGQRGRAQAHRSEIRPAPGSDPTGRQAERGGPAGGRGGEQHRRNVALGVRQRSAELAAQPLPVLDPAHLLEHRQPVVAVGADGDPAPGYVLRAEPRGAVAEISLGERTETYPTLGREEALHVGRRGMRAVHGRDRTVADGVQDHRHGRAAVGGDRLLDLAALLLDVQVHRHAPTPALGVDRRDLGGARRPDAVGGHAHRLRGRLERGAQAVDVAPEPVDARCGEPALRPLEWAARRAGGVVAVEQHQANTDVACRLEHGLVERKIALALVVHVVELAHRGDAGVAHFGERAGGDPPERDPVQRADQRVHRLAPGPEAARAAWESLAVTPKGTLKRMRVCVDEPRQQRHVTKHLRVGAAEVADGLDPAVRVDRDLHAGREALPHPGQCGREGSGHRRAQVR